MPKAGGVQNGARDIVVIGGSAGGTKGLLEIAKGLPANFPAAVFVVIHMSPDNGNFLPPLIAKVGKLPVDVARDGEEIRTGRIYVARANQHLLLMPGRVVVSRGPKENRFRPAVDPLFRSAAVAYGPRVVGIILSGALDDGAAGLWAIKQRGGLAIVQDPEEADVRSMPESAMRVTKIDYRLSLAQIAATLVKLVGEPAADANAFPLPEGIDTETRIAMQDETFRAGLTELGEPSMFTCPECHGVLLRLNGGGGLRYRCHTGHAFTAKALLAELAESAEGALWNAARTIEESWLLMEHIAGHVRESGDTGLAELFDRKATEVRERGDAVKRIAMTRDSVSDGLLDKN